MTCDQTETSPIVEAIVKHLQLVTLQMHFSHHFNYHWLHFVNRNKRPSQKCVLTKFRSQPAIRSNQAVVSRFTHDRPGKRLQFQGANSMSRRC